MHCSLIMHGFHNGKWLILCSKNIYYMATDTDRLSCNLIPGGGGHFNFVCTGDVATGLGKLTHPQTKAGPSINKNTPILRLFTTEID